MRATRACLLALDAGTAAVNDNTIDGTSIYSVSAATYPEQLIDPITPYDLSSIPKVLVPVSVAGWLLFGITCILCINGRGKLGRWVPEWYLDSEGTVWDKALVGLWWLAVMVLWPVILPVLLAKKIVSMVRSCLGERRMADEPVFWPREMVETV